MSYVITETPEVLLQPFAVGIPGPLAILFSDEERGQFEDTERFLMPTFARKPLLLEVLVYQSDSEENSIEKYIGHALIRQKHVFAVYARKVSDSISFYTLTEDDSEETIDGLVEVERTIYERFFELDIEFHILLGQDSENLVPTGSLLVCGKP